MKRTTLWLIAITVCVAVMSSCSSNEPTTASKNYFTLWNDCEALTALQEYVEDVSDPKLLLNVSDAIEGMSEFSVTTLNTLTK